MKRQIYPLPGVTTREVDKFAASRMKHYGAKSAFLGYRKFPGNICISVNEQVVHGFPSGYKLKEGDIFSIDCGATLEGFVGDTATTVPVGKVADERLRLIQITEECLDLAIEQCRAGNHLGDIGWAVQQHAEANGYSVVRDYVGHGIGRRMHEDPQIPNYGKPGLGPKIKAGYVFAVEPMVNKGTHFTKVLPDGWTVVTMDGQPSAHVEHTIAITEEGPEVLTRVPLAKPSVSQTVACN